MPSGETENVEETQEEHPAQRLAAEIADEQDCDVLILNARILRPLDARVINECRQRKRRKNILFILVTEGGDADASYRIAHCLQESYDKFTCIVSGYCKSAGTLLALGANELVISDHGELGPLDVQMSKEDELGVMRSGLTIHSALATLHSAAYNAFEHFFLEIKSRSGGAITTPTAVRVATSLSGKLFAPIYGHVDAMHIGEADRMLKIAYKYGQVLMAKSLNFREETLAKLTANYPSHGFVIDRQQAEELFENVRSPNEKEEELISHLKGMALEPIPLLPSVDPCLIFLNPETQTENQPIHQGGPPNERPNSHEDPVTAHGQDDKESGQSSTSSEVPGR